MTPSSNISMHCATSGPCSILWHAQGTEGRSDYLGSACRTTSYDSILWVGCHWPAYFAPHGSLDVSMMTSIGAARSVNLQRIMLIGETTPLSTLLPRVGVRTDATSQDTCKTWSEFCYSRFWTDRKRESIVYSAVRGQGRWWETQESLFYDEWWWWWWWWWRHLRCGVQRLRRQVRHVEKAITHWSCWSWARPLVLHRKSIHSSVITMSSIAHRPHL